ncbi:hypothetical protein NDU88_001615 [Pleurodeles waltl]|uniref:Uncharacterized protein n=1 Tax=Pleurodeles waltl TaxID=8319 RepID=A0AAV7ND39_PLEWA|nr:hypothetical protein NDU88_001615 [Pleurodeles waltl]
MPQGVVLYCSARSLGSAAVQLVLRLDPGPREVGTRPPGPQALSRRCRDGGVGMSLLVFSPPPPPDLRFTSLPPRAPPGSPVVSRSPARLQLLIPARRRTPGGRASATASVRSRKLLRPHPRLRASAWRRSPGVFRLDERRGGSSALQRPGSTAGAHHSPLRASCRSPTCSTRLRRGSQARISSTGRISPRPPS